MATPRGSAPPGAHDRLDVSADVAAAATLPGSFYNDASVLAGLREGVFAATWQFLDAAPPDARAARPVTLLPGCLDEPLLLASPAAGDLRCLSNVCTHRAHLVCPEEGATEGLRCRYHGRRFALDGALRNAPEFEGARDFPRPEDDLPRLPLERLGPLLFTALRAPALSFDRWLAPLRERLAGLPFDALRPAPERSRDFDVAANWALYCDNYLEGFHIPFVHPALNEAVEFASYRNELFGHGTLQVAMARRARDAFALPPDSPDHGTPVAAYYYWFFPNLMLNVYPWGVSLNLVTPLDVDRTRVSFRSFVWRAELLAGGAGGDLDTVEREDEEVVESVQRGVRSRLYDRGRFAPRQEPGVHLFHRLLAAAARDDRAREG